MSSPSLSAGGVLRRSSHAGQAPQEGGGDDGNGSDRLDVHADGRTDGRPAEDERYRIRLLRTNDPTSDLQQLRQVQSLSAAHRVMQHLRHGQQGQHKLKTFTKALPVPRL